MVITRLCVFLYWAARDGYKPVVFCRGWWGWWCWEVLWCLVLKGFFGGGVCVTRAVTVGGFPGRQSLFLLILYCFG
jgi:hypothetical protein